MAAGLGPLEAEVMQVLWRAGRPLPVREVAAALNAERTATLAYTTVMTVMSRLAGKGILARSRAGRRFVYAPVAADAAEIAVRGVLEEFGDAALGWPLPTSFDTINVTVVLATATMGLVAVLQVAGRAAAGSVALRALLRYGRPALPPVIHDASAELGLDGRVDVVAAREPFAVTYALV